jgi:hypothetical protein
MGVMEGESHSLTISEGVHWDDLSLQQTFVFITSTPNLRVLPGSSISSRVYLLPRDHVESESLGFRLSSTTSRCSSDFIAPECRAAMPGT